MFFAFVFISHDRIYGRNRTDYEILPIANIESFKVISVEGVVTALQFSMKSGDTRQYQWQDTLMGLSADGSSPVIELPEIEPIKLAGKIIQVSKLSLT